MSKSKEIRLLNDRLDYYTMEVEDDQFDAEEVIRISVSYTHLTLPTT